MAQHEKVAIVVTTIFEPVFLNGYLNNIETYDRKKNTIIIIIPDKKTPNSVAIAANHAMENGFNVKCPTLDEQNHYLKRLGISEDFIPYNTDNRRNVGFLMALEWGCDVLISIDDDNYCQKDIDFIGEHLVVGNTSRVKPIQSSDGWFNVCSMLKTSVSVETYPRGFPYEFRGKQREVIQKKEYVKNNIAINAGLWLDDPDIDALSRLTLNTKSISIKSESVILADDTWTPLNTQNTSMIREAARIYYYVRMGFPLKGMKIDRYGDILSGFFVQKCIKHLRENIRIGSPVAQHHRTQHNIFKDLYNELAGIVICEELVPWLKNIKLTGDTYIDVYGELASRLIDNADKFSGFVWDDGGREFLKETGNLMKRWITAVRTIS